MPTRCLFATCLIVLGICTSLRASEEEYVSWAEVRIVGVEHEQTGKVVFAAKMAEEKLLEVTLEAFGQEYKVGDEDLELLQNFPLNSLSITHEAGYENLGGHMVHFKLKTTTYNQAGNLVESRAILSVTKKNGLTVKTDRTIIKIEKPKE